MRQRKMENKRVSKTIPKTKLGPTSKKGTHWMEPWYLILHPCNPSPQHTWLVCICAIICILHTPNRPLQLAEGALSCSFSRGNQMSRLPQNRFWAVHRQWPAFLRSLAPFAQPSHLYLPQLRYKMDPLRVLPQVKQKTCCGVALVA